jgi:nitrate/TMAO reductase-like tetraheme cytochrome c subunit
MAGVPGADSEFGDQTPDTSTGSAEKKKLPLIGGFRDPSRRPRYIIWTGVGILAFAAFLIIALGATSTYWFCSSICHKVQDDSIIAYGRSSHNKVSCMSCHEPVNADPITFILKKAEALGELYLTATNKYELPLNPESELSKEMESEQCTQCHNLENRTVTPGYGIIINHTVHEEKDISCTQCHNRIAHRENFELTLKNPDGSPSHKHEDFMKMEACFRCHSQEKGGKAPGECRFCHTKGFPLKPANHDAPKFYNKFGDSSGHWKLYNERPTYCPTCHTKKFCTDCHGIEMPHPPGFEKNHGKEGAKDPEVCANCHAKSAGTAQGTEFCNACHHKAGNPRKPWLPQHSAVVQETGATACFDCHDPVFCARCHVSGGKP